MERISLTIDSISSDLLVSKEFLDEVTCAICLQILYNPVACKQCNNPFCKNCITDWTARSNTCPNRCNYQEAQINPFAKKLLDKLKLKCTNHIEGCSEQIHYEDYIKHISEKCQFTLFKCSACGMSGRKNLIGMHINMCEHFKDPCPYCKTDVLRKLLQSHIATCTERTTECEHCEMVVKYNQMEAHLSQCGAVKVSCGYCGASYRRSKEDEHIRTVCRDNMRAKGNGHSNQKSILEENNDLKSKLVDEMTRRQAVIEKCKVYEVELDMCKKTVERLNNEKVLIQQYMNEASNRENIYKKKISELESQINQMVINQRNSGMFYPQNQRGGSTGNPFLDLLLPK
jgi:hypothetical protein